VLDVLIYSYNYYNLIGVIATFEGSALHVMRRAMYE